MNMRKIVAILATVLMLCAAIPMGALSVAAAPGDVILDINFDDGSNGGFERSYNEDGVLVFDASTGDWQNTYLGGVNGFQKNVDYVVTFKAKADRNAELNFKINSDWAYDSAKFTVNVTTEWQEYEGTINMSELGWAIVMFSSNTLAADGATYYIDDLKIAEYKAPVQVGKITNGDFENGSEGWKLNASASIENGALKLDNSGLWSEAAMTDITVEVGTEYVLSWKSQRISGNGAYLMFVLKGSDLSNHPTAGQNWMNSTSTDWLTHELKFTATEAELKLKISPEKDNPGVILIDDIKLTAQKTASSDGYIKNGDFETGDGNSWTLYSGTAVADYAAKNGEYGLHIKNPNGGWGGTAFQDFSVEAGKSYEVTMWAKTLAGSRGQNIQIQNGGATVASKWFDNHTEWTLLTFEFTATATNTRINICGGGTGANEEIYVDDIKVKELKQASFDGYITNGDFETGEFFPWDNLWGSCPTVEIVEGGKDSDYALHIVSNKWNHVRQTAIAVEPNTWYKVTAWAKNTSDMVLLVKDGGDNDNLNQTVMTAGEEWTEFTGVFNTGDYTTIIVSLMGGENGEIAEKYGIFDNISLEITEEPHVCEFVVTDSLEATCEEDGYNVYTCECGETYTEVITAYHNGNLEYHAAVEAIDCANPGNIEYWFCPGCYEYFADAEATEMLNPWYINITIDCVRPEGIADCATVTCETCGNEIYGYGEHDVLACQGGTCSKCGDEIEGYGCANYDTPACEDGVCYYCGGFVAGFGHENGAWAPCCDGECAYGCGLIYPATEDHVDEDGNDYCDNCWSHLAHIDEDGNGECDVCWLPMPEDEPDVEIIYGDANGDGEISTMDVVMLQQYTSGATVEGMNEAAADANGDGEITTMDVVLLQQLTSGWDVVLGPQG